MSGRKEQDRVRFRRALRTLGQRIVKAREALNWTQEQLADEAGLNWKTIGKIERAEVACALDSLLLIAGALRMPSATLLRDLESLVDPPSEML